MSDDPNAPKDIPLDPNGIPLAFHDSPIRPTKEYETITLREFSAGFAGGVQDMTLYPEDTMETDEAGNIKIVFVTMGGGEFVAYASHMQWHSWKESQHLREKGTLRPDPQKMMSEFQERQKAERLGELQRLSDTLMSK